MGQPITPFTIKAPGFYGLNNQDSPVELDAGFALMATNCVIDKSGRIAARNGWTTTNTTNADLGSADVKCIAELVKNDGSTVILAAGNGCLFTLSGSTLTKLTYGGGGVAPTISDNNWQFVQLNGVGVFFQLAHDPLIYDPAVSTTQFRRLNEKTGYSGTVLLANCAVSAFGRIWCANTSTDTNTIKFSDVKTTHIWTGGTSGSLDLLGVWPHGGDSIVALGAHNNQLIIFGKKQILVYTGADTPATMALGDSIDGIGCINRDTVQNTGEDLIFLSDTGVRSIRRTIQEKSAPLRDLSKNVRDDLLLYTNIMQSSEFKSAYSPLFSFYLLTLPTVSMTYCFDMRTLLQDGSSRATTWENIAPKCFMNALDGTLYIGKPGYIGKYGGFLDNTTSYRMSYYTTWIDFGNPIQTSILKKIMITVIGTTNQSIVLKWAYDYIETYNVQVTSISTTAPIAEYGIAEYGIAEYMGNLIVNVISVNGGGSGTVMKFGFETEINNYAVSLQKIDIFTKEGRL